MYEKVGSYYIVCYWDFCNCGGQLVKMYNSKAWAIKKAQSLLTHIWCKRVRVLEMPVLHFDGTKPSYFDDVVLRNNVFESAKA